MSSSLLGRGNEPPLWPMWVLAAALMWSHSGFFWFKWNIGIFLFDIFFREFRGMEGTGIVGMGSQPLLLRMFPWLLPLYVMTNDISIGLDPHIFKQMPIRRHTFPRSAWLFQACKTYNMQQHLPGSGEQMSGTIPTKIKMSHLRVPTRPNICSWSFVSLKFVGSYSAIQPCNCYFWCTCVWSYLSTHPSGNHVKFLLF